MRRTQGEGCSGLGISGMGNILGGKSRVVVLVKHRTWVIFLQYYKKTRSNEMLPRLKLWMTRKT